MDKICKLKINSVIAREPSHLSLGNFKTITQVAHCWYLAILVYSDNYI